MALSISSLLVASMVPLNRLSINTRPRLIPSVFARKNPRGSALIQKLRYFHDSPCILVLPSIIRAAFWHRPNGPVLCRNAFAHRASVAASLQGFLMLVIGSISSGLASLVRIDSGFQIAAIFGCLLGIEVLALRLLNNPRMTALS